MLSSHDRKHVTRYVLALSGAAYCRPTLLPVMTKIWNVAVCLRHLWDVMAHWLRRLLSTGGSWVRLPLWPSRSQVLYLQLPVRFGVKLRYCIRAIVGSASEW